MLDRHCESAVFVGAPMDSVFARLDDHTRLSAHMSESSWQMGGGKMSISFDAGRGQKVGSHIVLAGRVLGISLFVDEVVTRREPPQWKVWETVGTPRLVVIGAYRMGFELTPEPSGSRLRVFIDYDLPNDGLFARWLGSAYARWCTRRMARDAAASFAK
jgi:hypothetical protein